jgi:hypothetical protein
LSPKGGNPAKSRQFSCDPEPPAGQAFCLHHTRPVEIFPATMLLPIVTGVALVVGAIMSGVAWKLAREEDHHPTVLLSAIAMIVVAVASVVMLVIVVDDRPAAAVAGAPPVARAPLELLAVSPERDGDRLTIRGIVRNPEQSRPVDRLVAVVVVLGEQGDFIASGRALVDPPNVAPGAESAFSVTVAGASEVARYRVSFRDDARVVAHIDRRGRSSTVAVP